MGCLVLRLAASPVLDMVTKLLNYVLRAAVPAVLLLCATMAPAMAQPQAPLLQVTQAFQLHADIQEPGRIQLHWKIADHYYLYRGRIHIKATGDAVKLGTLALPAGHKEHDQFLGDVEIYHHKLTATLPYTVVDAEAGPIQLAVEYQGCHEVAPQICYPPHTEKVSLPLTSGSGSTAGGNTQASGANTASAASDTRFLGSPLMASSATATASSASAAAAVAHPPPSNPSPSDHPGGASESATGAQSGVQQLAAGLAGHDRWLALLGFLGAGLLLAFTPCVLPMIPILSGLIAGAGARRQLSSGRAFVLSAVYVLASSVVFVIAGVIAGLVGASLQAAFQSPWLLGAFALIFVLLALSMFGFYELRPPAALQRRMTAASNRQQGGSLTGVAVMGVLSALIVGPCVAPPLAGAVLYIAQSHDPAFGALALFLLAIGMGIPLVIFGTAAGRWLPRAGAWMKTVQAVFGVIFLALAVWMLSRFLDPVWIMLMSGALLIGSGVYMGAFDRLTSGVSGWRRLWKAAGLVLLLLGATELVGVTAGSRNLLAPLATLGDRSAGMQAPEPDFRSVDSITQLRQALAQARDQGKPVMLDFYADWCVSCKEMEHFTYRKPEVREAMSHFLLIKADVTENSRAERALLKHFGLFGPPATIFYNTDGKQLTGLELIGFESAGKFRKRLTRAENS